MAATSSATTKSELPDGDRRLRILHVIIVLGETNGQYNEHCLPLRHERELAICTYFAPQLVHPPEIEVFAGDGTLRGFFRAFSVAVTAGQYDVIHAHAPQTGSLVALALALRPHQRRALWRSLVYTVQDSFHDYKTRNKLLMAPALATFRRVVFCGHAAYDSYPPLWKCLAGRRARVVQNAADLDRVERAIVGRTRSTKGAAFDVVSVGRLEKVKDPLTALAAFRLLDDPGSRLTFVGAGSLETGLAAAIRSSGLGERIELTGLVSRDDVFVRCAEADLFVSTSLGEGLPVAVIEAMATGCPAVLSDIPPHREVAAGADFIPIVPTGDPEGFAREISRFRHMPGRERRAIGERCRNLVRDRFGLATMHAALETVYRELT